MIRREGSDPPELFAWDAGHECGVTGDPEKAIGYVHSALVDGPAGAAGTVRRVVVGTSGFVEYVDLGEVAHACRDEASGAVVWQDGAGSADWTPVTDPAREIDGFAVFRSVDGDRWRAVHRYDHDLAFEFGDWARLDTRCWAARIARGLRATYARTGSHR